MLAMVALFKKHTELFEELFEELSEDLSFIRTYTIVVV
jgi:hypothetical protein